MNIIRDLIPKKWRFLIIGLLIFPVATFFDYMYIRRYTLLEYFGLNLIELTIFWLGVMTGENWTLDEISKKHKESKKNDRK